MTTFQRALTLVVHLFNVSVASTCYIIGRKSTFSKESKHISELDFFFLDWTAFFLGILWIYNSLAAVAVFSNISEIAYIVTSVLINFLFYPSVVSFGAQCLDILAHVYQVHHLIEDFPETVIVTAVRIFAWIFSILIVTISLLMGYYPDNQYLHPDFIVRSDSLRYFDGIPLEDNYISIFFILINLALVTIVLVEKIKLRQNEITFIKATIGSFALIGAAFIHHFMFSW